ncbi:ClpP/crotonase [Trichodelitschia bisporula]|uniref:ClpP/crotonase n=1 Tax=Trichodelitschia bisporula TaxID=703511 RepID=A0A6G1HVK3_9PEZI|nr:ClpP/crotonase [Trichodelitschia bisporula]
MPALRVNLFRAAYRCYSTPARTIRVRTLPAPHTGVIRVLELDRPAARNAISRQLLAELRSEVDSLYEEGESGETRALVIGSVAENVFCAGADLKERKGMDEDETRAFLANLRSTFAALAALPIPTIAAVHGSAFGGGLELALAMHLRVFAENTLVGLPETRLGIIPGAGGTHRLPALIGVGRARDMILTGRRVSGSEAYFLGLCDRLVEVNEGEHGEIVREMVMVEAEELAREICEGGPVAVRQALRAVNGWKRGQEAEDEAYEVVLRTSDRVEALKAFAEKRKPVFEGR